MAGLIVPVSGPYIGTWNALPLGTLSDDGYVITATFQGQEVNESDAYGQTLVEAIYRGANWRCRIRGLEFQRTGLLSLLQMFGQSGAAGTLTPLLGPIGDRWTKYCQSMVLTAILANPPTMPQTLTALQTGLAPNSSPEFMITSKMRELPMELVLIPYQAGGSAAIATPFTTT